MTRPLTILAVDDDPGDLDILRRHLEQVPGFTISFVEALNTTAARAALTEYPADVIFLDHLLGLETGLDFLRELRQGEERHPIIMLTGKGDERLAAAAMRSGADDYLVKEDLNPETIHRSLRFVLERYDNERKRAEFEAELMRMARFDELTGVANRRYLLDRLTQEMLRTRRYGSPLCILMLDLDHFKRINDTYGHIMGDTVLATVASILRQTIRATDIPGRYGGEEFCVVLTETKADGAYLVAERLRRRIAAEAFPAADGQSFHVTCSIGLAPYHETIKDVLAFIARADQALYRAKAAGRDRIMHAPDEP